MRKEEQIKNNLEQRYKANLKDYLKYKILDDKLKTYTIANCVKDVFGEKEGKQLINKWVEEVEKEQLWKWKK